MSIIPLSLEEIARMLPGLEKTLILGHINPDADCTGSALALCGLIRAMQESPCGEIKVAFPSPLPRHLSFLAALAGMPAEEFLLKGGEAEGFDTILAVDVASPEQLGAFSSLAPHVRFMIDHHKLGSPFAPHFIDPKAAASGEIIFRLYRSLWEAGRIGELPEVARFLYCAIVGDTGGFQFANTTPETHRNAAVLLDEINRDAEKTGGCDTAELCRRLLDESSLSELKAKAVTINNLRLFEEGRLAGVLLTAEIVQREGLDETDLGTAISIPRSLTGVKVAVTVRQLANEPTRFKVSSRANEDLDCASICARFGGGGHRRAAGCTVEANSPEEAFAQVTEAFSALVR